jgi:HPt (histidine-containing phosphotransfer) domain-containing protein
MALIKKHIEMGDASGVREAAHSLKGASGTFGKTPVFETAYILEKMGIDGNLDNAMAMWNTLNQLLDQLHALIHAALETGDPA